MPRLVNGERRIDALKPENAGKLLIFCEGHTEYNYLKYLKDYIERHQHTKYSNIVVEPINTEGNAKHVYDYAQNYLSDDENNRKYIYYEKHLVFDCDAPDNIQDVIILMTESSNQYFLDYSNLLFETWLVMHFQDLQPGETKGKREVIRLIRDYLNISKYTSKNKADKGIIGIILGSNGNERIRAAIKNAKEMEQYWNEREKVLTRDIKKMNPSVEIYKLIERILDEIDYSCR